MENNAIVVLTYEQAQQLIEAAILKALQIHSGQQEQDNTLLTTQQVCTQYHITRMTLNTYTRTEKIFPQGRQGKHLLYRKSDCDKVLLNVRKMNQHI